MTQINQKPVRENITYNKKARCTWPTECILLEFNKVTDICEENIYIAGDLHCQETQAGHIVHNYVEENK
jgi:hypothetical protein